MSKSNTFRLVKTLVNYNITNEITYDLMKYIVTNKLFDMLKSNKFYIFDSNIVK